MLVIIDKYLDTLILAFLFLDKEKGSALSILLHPPPYLDKYDMGWTLPLTF